MWRTKWRQSQHQGKQKITPRPLHHGNGPGRNFPSHLILPVPLFSLKSRYNVSTISAKYNFFCGEFRFFYLFSNSAGKPEKRDPGGTSLRDPLSGETAIISPGELH